MTQSTLSNPSIQTGEPLSEPTMSPQFFLHETFKNTPYMLRLAQLTDHMLIILTHCDAKYSSFCKMTSSNIVTYVNPGEKDQKGNATLQCRRNKLTINMPHAEVVFRQNKNTVTLNLKHQDGERVQETHAMDETFFSDENIDNSINFIKSGFSEACTVKRKSSLATLHAA